MSGDQEIAAGAAKGGVPIDLGLDEAATDRVAGQFDAVAHAELLEHVGPVTIDGLLADESCPRSPRW